MNKTVPTLLGIAVILLVLILVLSIYHMTMLMHLAQGERVVGTTAQKVLSGGEVGTEEISPSEPLAAHMTKQEAVSATELQEKAGKSKEVQAHQAKREARQGRRTPGKEAGTKPGGG